MSDDQCTATIYDQGTQMSCALLPGHVGVHVDGRYGWGPSDTTVHVLPTRGAENPCGATLHNGTSSLYVCQREPGHSGDHQDRNFQWNPMVRPLPEKSREAQWEDRIRSAGGNRDELILQLFERVEQLEQTSAGGAAVDDMFATMNRARQRLAQGLGEVEKRMTRLEQAQVYGPGPHDLSALQASIKNHINRALADLGAGLGIRLNAMQDVLTRQQAAVLAQLIPEPEPVTHVEPGLDYTTERASGSPAAVRCSTRFREGQCLGYAGHDGECSAIQGGEQLEDSKGFEHTSYASLDYLNRHGAPDEREPFVESTYDRTSDGTPLEEF